MQLTTRAVRALIPLATLAALSGGLAACGGDDNDQPARATSPSGASNGGGGARGVGVNPADAAYVRQMLPHDAQVAVLASQIGATSTNPKIKALAQSSREAVTTELRALRAFAVARRYDLDKADVRQQDDAKALGTTVDELGTVASLSATEGKAGDKAFVDFLIKHHEGSLVMSRAVRKLGNDDTLADLSKEHVKQLRGELRQLRALADEL